MRAPLSWLRDYAPLEAPVDDLAATLSALGLVVEGVHHVGGGLGGVVVSKVLGIRRHPDADRIRLVDVDAGNGEVAQIVCGAWNFAEGDLVPLARVGAVLPGGMEISRRKMRGEWSDGMLCSASELDIPEPPGSADGTGPGLMILPRGLAEPGAPLADALELGPDVVFDLDVSSNRPDALCMAGVARDLAAALGEPWAALSSGSVLPPVDRSVGVAPITVEAGDLCPRFVGTVFEDVPLGASPAWIARRLTLAGMRPISAVVDVSNYVMLDVGQPNHAYDLDRLGGGGILVRRGAPGEILETLDGVSRTLGPEDCVICDATGGAVGVGGIMGGASAEIGPGTTRVLLETAWFQPMAIARTGSRLGLHSEARVRFERGVDPEVAPWAVERFAALLAAVAPAASGGRTLRRGPSSDVRDDAHMPAPAVVRVRTARVNAILGTDLDDGDVAGLLGPIGFRAEAPEPGVHAVTVPSWRLDSAREIDVIEEVARLWGYGRIERTVPAARGGSGGLTGRQRDRRFVRQALAGAGFDEAWTSTFLAPGDLERAGLDPAAVEVENPLDRSESILRTALLPGLLKAVKFNMDRQGVDVRLFEVGTVFFLPGEGRVTPEEVEHVAAIVGPGPATEGAGAVRGGAGGAGGAGAVRAAVLAWSYLAEALGISGVSLSAAAVPGMHPSRAANIVAGDGALIGAVGEVAPEVRAAYGLGGRVGYLTASLDALLGVARRRRQARDVSRFPGSDVDLAFVVDERVPAAAVLATLREAGGELLEAASLFDVFRGGQVGTGRRSLAFRLRFRASDRTLAEGEIAAARQREIDAVTAAHGAELRG